MKAQYYIVAVRYDERHTISKVRIYQNDDIFEESKVFVLLGLASGYLIKTAFQERDGQWHEGAVVQQYKKNEGLHGNLWVNQREIHQNPSSVKRQSGITAPVGRFYSVCRLTAART